jgi:FkbM family methyltransferase
MWRDVEDILKVLARRLNVKVIKYSRYDQLRSFRQDHFDLELIKSLDAEKRSAAIELLSQSASQIRQDIFALAMNNFKRNGFFVEFGATDGKTLSNTYLLEAQFGWTGILAEPARAWHETLNVNRQSIVEKRCVWTATGQHLQFSEASIPELSSLMTSELGARSTGRRLKNYSVETVSLTDLLAQNNAPELIDFLSIDTEGSELDILSAHDFSRFNFRVITCEHNYQDNREKIHDLLMMKGYKRVLPEVSQFDDWYLFGRG